MRGEHFHHDRPVELFLKALEHDPHAASADDLKNIDPVEPAECFFIQRGGEKVDRKIRQRVFVKSLRRGFFPAQLCRRKAALSAAAGLFTQSRADPSPLGLLCGEPFQFSLAGNAARKVLDQLLFVPLRKSVLQRTDQQVAIAGQSWWRLSQLVAP
jgi:hypothetical protein